MSAAKKPGLAATVKVRKRGEYADPTRTTIDVVFPDGSGGVILFDIRDGKPVVDCHGLDRSVSVSCPRSGFGGEP